MSIFSRLSRLVMPCHDLRVEAREANNEVERQLSLMTTASRSLSEVNAREKVTIDKTQRAAEMALMSVRKMHEPGP